MPHVYMLEPYQPNKKVIVLIHGLASSPETWVNLTNNILGDKVLRENFQVWQVFYSTNMPIVESRFQ
ncbi:esterase/lipase family protein, partial [Klebsiella sp. K47]